MNESEMIRKFMKALAEDMQDATERIAIKTEAVRLLQHEYRAMLTRMEEYAEMLAEAERHEREQK